MSRLFQCIAMGVFLLSSTAAFPADLWVDTTYTGVIHDGTETRPYKTINDAIGSADSGDTIRVKPGVYEEDVVIDNNLTLSGTGPDSTVIVAQGGRGIFVRANFNVTIEKLTILHGSYGIDLETCTSTVAVAIRNVVCAMSDFDGFRQNTACTANVAIRNCTFYDNGSDGVEAKATCTNCISISNGQLGYRGLWSNDSRVVYSNAWNNGENAQGQFQGSNADGLNTDDPAFVDPDTGDLRLSVSSTCRNAGTPDQAMRNPDGSRNDMGAYGGPYAAGFYNGYGSGPVVTDLHVTPGSVPLGGTINITATGTAE